MFSSLLGPFVALNRNTIKNTTSSQPRKPLHRSKRERKHFYHWISARPECHMHHRPSPEEIVKTEGSLVCWVATAQFGHSSGDPLGLPTSRRLRCWHIQRDGFQASTEVVRSCEPGEWLPEPLKRLRVAAAPPPPRIHQGIDGFSYQMILLPPSP